MPSMQWLTTWDDLARKRVIAVTDALAARIGVEPAAWANRTSRDPIPTARSVGELEALAIVAESVQRVSAEVEELRARVASLPSVADALIGGKR